MITFSDSILYELTNNVVESLDQFVNLLVLLLFRRRGYLLTVCEQKVEKIEVNRRDKESESNQDINRNEGATTV